MKPYKKLGSFLVFKSKLPDLVLLLACSYTDKEKWLGLLKKYGILDGFEKAVIDEIHSRKICYAPKFVPLIPAEPDDVWEMNFMEIRLYDEFLGSNEDDDYIKQILARFHMPRTDAEKAVLEEFKEDIKTAAGRRNEKYRIEQHRRRIEEKEYGGANFKLKVKSVRKKVVFDFK